MGQGTTVQKSQIVGTNGTVNASVAGYGHLRVTQEMTTLLYDPHDGSSIDTTNIWNTATQTAGGTVAISAGVVTLSSSTTVSSVAALVSRQSFVASVPGFCQHSYALKFESQSSNLFTTAGYRFWGVGTVPGTPTPSLPMTDAVGFEIDSNGKMWAVVYAAGTKTQISSGVGDGSLMTTGSSKAPSDNAYHRYVIIMRTDRTYFYIDSLETPVATSNFQMPSTQTLPVRLMALSSTSSQPTQVQILSTGLAVADSGKNSSQISDGTYPWRKAQVTSAGALVIQESDSQVTTTGITSAPNTTAVVTLNGDGALGVVITLASGSLTSTTFQFEASVDGTNWVLCNMHPCSTIQQPGGSVTAVTTTALPRTYIGSAPGFQKFRVNVTALTGTSPNLTIAFDQSSASFYVRQPVMSTPSQFIFDVSGSNSIAAPGAGLSIYVTDMCGTNGGNSANRVDIKDNNTLMFSFMMAAAGGGFSVNLSQPWKLTANNPLGVTTSAFSQYTYITINYYIAP